jgi:hypothetical protein
MRRLVVIVFLCLLPLTGRGEQRVPSDHGQVARAKPAQVFAPALAQLHGKTQIPILLPSRLPWLDDPTAIRFAWGEIRDHGYFISLYYDKETSNATYFAGFGASTKIDPDPGERGIRLANGSTAHFSPVSCGGSCAPANLWWVQNGVEYHIQIKFSSAERKRFKKDSWLRLQTLVFQFEENDTAALSTWDKALSHNFLDGDFMKVR